MKSMQWMVLAALVWLVGCSSATSGGAASPGHAKAEQPYYGPDQVEAEWSANPAAPSPTPSPASGEGRAADEASPSSAEAARAPQSRPGLGTVWGEDRTSHVSTTAFFRADRERPFAAVTVFYNDAQGVGAMADASRRSDWGDNAFPAAQSQLSVRILGSDRRPLPGTRAGGRTYVVGEAGQAYLIQVQNHTGNRVEVVASVDGLDVLDGQPGSFRKRGYILAPWGLLEIEGFRRSHETVAAFRFGAVGESYAARKGQPRNVGVIGVAFFAEEGSRWPWTDGEIRYRHDADPFPGRYADPPPPSW